MRVKIRCPNCEQVLMVREEEVGKPGKCPMCKQQVMLLPPKKAGNPGPAPAQPGATAPSSPRAANDQGIALALAPDEQASVSNASPQQMAAISIAPLAVEELEEDIARQQVSLRGTVPTAASGPPPPGKQRRPGLAFLAALVPFYAIYWYIVARSEMAAHRRQPPRTAGHMALKVGLLVVTGGLFGWLYCCYLVPKRILEMQSTCGDPDRVGVPSCIILGIIPVIGWALIVFKLQKALTTHWQWHENRASDSVTAGLAS